MRPTTPSRAPARVNVARASARTSPLRVQRRRTRLIAFVVFLFLMIVAAFGLSYASYLPRYMVHDFRIAGTQTVPSDLVARYVDTQLNPGVRPFFSRNNILMYDPRSLQASIVGFFPRIKSATVSRASMLATAITVTVQERQEFALWCAGLASGGRSDSSDCYSMDESGFIFAPAASSSRGLIFSGGFSASVDSTTSTNSGQASSPQAASSTAQDSSETSSSTVPQSIPIHSIDSEQAGLPQANPIGRSFAPGHLPGILALFDQLTQIDLTPTGASVDDNRTDFVVSLSQGFDIKASFGQDAAGLVRNLQLILSADVLQGKQSDIQYVDLRFGDRAYYKLKGSTSTSTPVQ